MTALLLSACAAWLAAAPIAIVDARVEAGNGAVLEGKTIVVVDGERIVSVGVFSGALPKDAVIVNGAGKVLTPGLIHVGSQVGLVEIGLERSTVDVSLSGAVPGFRAIDGFNTSSPRVAIDRAEGVTSIVLSPEGPLLAGTGFVVDLAGDPAAVTRARRAAVFGGFGMSAKDAAGGARGGVVLELRRALDDTRFFLANRAAYDRNATRALALPRVHLEALGGVAQKKLPLAMRADRAADIRALLAFAKEQRVDVIVLGGAEAWLVADELAAANTPVVILPSAGEPSSFDALYARDDNASLLHQKGVRVILSPGGTDLGTTRVRQEAGIAVSYGMPRNAALKAVTLEAARAFGADQELGSIEKGKRADLVLWSGDPFETTTVAEAVWIRGERADLATRHKALAERYKLRNAARTPSAPPR
jgi:imidazolonepropionase-like amidohydrolase